MAILNCIIGIIFVFLVAFLISNNKKKINWKTVIIGFFTKYTVVFIIPVMIMSILFLDKPLQYLKKVYRYK